MRILAFSGSHGNMQVSEAFIDRLGKVEDLPDVFVSTGDLGPCSMLRIFSALSEHGVPILYVHGNHILHYPRSVVEFYGDKIQKLQNVHHLDNSRFEKFGWNFIGQDAGTDFTDDKNDPARYRDLVEKSRGNDPLSTVLVTHHAPLGIFDTGSSYPIHSYTDANGIMHAGSLAIRFFVDQFAPRIHMFAHCHADGNRSSIIDGTLFANVCHLERRTRDGKYGVTGSFCLLDTDSMEARTYHLSQTSPRTCPGCGAVNYIRYRRCVNCTKGSTGILPKKNLP